MSHLPTTCIHCGNPINESRYLTSYCDICRRRDNEPLHEWAVRLNHNPGQLTLNEEAERSDRN